MSLGRVTYTKEMREQAKESGTLLITLDTPMFKFQTPDGTPEMQQGLYDLLMKWQRERSEQED